MLIDELELESWLNEAGCRGGANHAQIRRALGSTYIRIPSSASRSEDRETSGSRAVHRPLRLRLVRVDSAKDREEVAPI